MSCPLAEAVLDALNDMRRRQRVEWDLVDTLRQAIVHRRAPRISTIADLAGVMMLDLGTRQDWLAFAHLVAERLPADTERDAA